MSIPVICPGCHKRFSVSDQFAGKKGPCPRCKHLIEVPSKEQAVEVHAPEAFAEGGRGTDGKLVTKPIDRKDTKLQPVASVLVVGSILGVIAVAWMAAGLIGGNAVVRGLGLLLVSPPLALAAYTFLRNDELEPYRGTALCIRAAICGTVYAILWGAFAFWGQPMVTTGEIWMWLVVAPPLFVVGASTAMASLDMDFGSGFFHYACYVLATILLAWIAGMGWPWDVVARSML